MQYQCHRRDDVAVKIGNIPPFFAEMWELYDFTAAQLCWVVICQTKLVQHVALLTNLCSGLAVRCEAGIRLALVFHVYAYLLHAWPKSKILIIRVITKNNAHSKLRDLLYCEYFVVALCGCDYFH